MLKVPVRSVAAVELTRNKFAAQVEGDTDLGCWLWRGRTTKASPDQSGDKGYGLISVGNHDWLAHRYSYGSFIGGHAPKLTLDHVCGVALCVRPDHLMPLTQQRNSELEHHRKTWHRELVQRDLLTIPNMPMNVMAWAMLKGLPIGRSQPGEKFGFGLDGEPFEHELGPAKYPAVKELFRG